jgi:predicted MFS family arabinose efflux permease
MTSRWTLPPLSSLLPRAERALDVLNVALADVRYGLGPYAIVYLMTVHSWDEAGIAFAFSFGGLAGLVSQVAVGAIVDAVRAKRALLLGAITVVTAAAFVIVFAPRFWPVAAAGVAGALANSTVGMTVAAISLGIVGPGRFARRAARNEALFHAGNAAINLVVLAAAPSFGIAVVFWMLLAAAVASAVAVLTIPASAIDHEVARGLPSDAAERGHRPSSWGVLLASRPLLAFAACGALFHMANASMLGLVVQRVALGDQKGAVSLAAASMIAAQMTMVATAVVAGARADIWGRRPFFLIAFAALALRGTLYPLSDDFAWTVAVQLLDGIGVGVFGALFPVVVADLARGSGHFNAAQGGVGTVHSVGGILSAPIANSVAVWAGYDAAFLTGAATAALGGILFWLVMPETKAASPPVEVSRAPPPGTL